MLALEREAHAARDGLVRPRAARRVGRPLQARDERLLEHLLRRQPLAAVKDEQLAEQREDRRVRAPVVVRLLGERALEDVGELAPLEAGDLLQELARLLVRDVGDLVGLRRAEHPKDEP